ncbi:tetratricopeptide repeat protein, partial [Streptomyces beijiangensis]
LADSERVLGADDPDTAVSRGNLALAVDEAGDLDRAIPLYEAALEASDDILGPDHAYTLKFGREFADSVRVLGPDDNDTLASRTNLAVAYGAAGHHAHALTHYEAALSGYERVFGPDHPLTVDARERLGRAQPDGP